MARTKEDLIDDAYSRLRISGITSEPTSDEEALALNRLEMMMEEYRDRNIELGYNFEETPVLTSLSNVPKKYWDAIGANLAMRLVVDFGKTPDPMLINSAQSGLAYLAAATADVYPAQYPSRMPRGRGNRIYRQRYNYYTPTARATITPTTYTMYIDDVEKFTENYAAYLATGETVSSVAISVQDGITVTSNSLSTPVLTYTVRADGNGVNTTNAQIQLELVATTSAGRKLTRVVDFVLLSTPENVTVV